jgi:hypothetical protein
VLARFVDGLTADDEQVLRGLLHQITADQDNPTPPTQGRSSRRERP